MRTVLRIGFVVFFITLLIGGVASAAGEECGQSVGATCCFNVVQNTTYCDGGLTCVSGVCRQQTPAPGDGIALTNPLGVGTLDEAILKVLRVLRDVGAPIAVVMVIIGGFQMLFSAGDPERFKAGRTTILYSVIGYAIIFLADGIAILIKNVLS